MSELVIDRSRSEPAATSRNDARVIRDDAEAIAVAHELAAGFAVGASDRDRDRRLPAAEIEQFSESGLWGITVPKAYGGAFVSAVTLAEVVRIISEADPNIGQIPQNHFYMVEAVRLDGTEEQKRFFFGLVLRGHRFGNAFSEVGTRSVTDVKTRLTPSGSSSGYVLNGKKFYSSGALLADWVPVVAKNDADETVVAFVERQAPGLTVIDDWSSFGQRTTASGTTILENVQVPEVWVIPHHKAFERPTTMGPIAQIIQAAVDVGIAGAALKDTLDFIRSQTRPWIDSGVERGCEDPLIISQVGDLVLKQHAAEAAAGARRRIHRPGHRRTGRGDGCRCPDCRGRGQGNRFGGRDPNHQQAVRAGRDEIDVGGIQLRPPLAQRPDAYAARSGALEVPRDRQLPPQRRLSASPSLAVGQSCRSQCPDASNPCPLERGQHVSRPPV